MSTLVKALLIAAAATVTAAPLQPESRQADLLAHEHGPWDAGAVTEYQIHPSCNHTQSRQIAFGLSEAMGLANHAKEHVLRWGHSSEHYRKYFGDEPSGEVIGYLEKIVSADKAGILFRCDNPDGNCALEGYAGHWRNENGSSETVICDLSYEARWSLSKMCALGYNVAEWPTNTFWASDLMHRLYHVPAIGEGHVEHYTDSYEEVIEMSENNGTYATHDSDILQYFALEVYAYDIAVPGVGCPGPEASGSSSSVEPMATSEMATSEMATSAMATSEMATSEMATAAPAATSSSTPTVSEAASLVSSIPPNCHTHEGGEIHCV